MGVPFGYWPVFWVFFWLWPALLVSSREDAFQEEDHQENNLPMTSSYQDDILDINQALIPLKVPESSFLIEGDIIKNTFQLFSSVNPRWPKKGGIVQIPYIISHKYDKPSVRIIQEAFEDFAKFTCIKFIPYSYQRDFISIFPLSGCFSSVGRIGGMQVVSLAPACLSKGKGVALHEFMHILGFWHEHARADRDKYIRISWNEILTGFEINFAKSWNTNMLVDYDYSSVLHYGRNAFSMTGLPTITPLFNSNVLLGQRWNLSSSDIDRINKLYKCSQVALQPETSTEKILQEKIKDFIPNKTEPCPTVSQIKLSTAQSVESIAEATEMAHSATETFQKSEDQTKVGINQLLNKTIGKSPDATGTSTTKILLADTLTQERHNQTLPPPESVSKTEYLTVGQEVPPETHPTETEVLVAQKSTLWQALEKPTSSAKELKTKASGFGGTYSPNQQKTTEGMTRTVPTSFRIDSPASLLNKIVQRTTIKPTEKVLHLPLSSTRAMHAEYVTEASTPIETRSLLVMGNSESKEVNGLLHSTEGYSLTLMEKQSEEIVQQSVSSSRNELDSFTYVPLMEAVQGKGTSSVHATTFPRVPENSAAASHVAGAEETRSSEAESQASYTTSNLSETTEEEVGSSYRTKENGLVYTQHSSTRSSPADDFGQLPYTEEALPLGSSEVQDHPLSQIDATVGTTSSWALITSHLAASRRKEAIFSQSGPLMPSVEVEWSSLPSGSLTRQGKWEENATPSDSFFETEWVQPTKMPMKSGQAPTKINSYTFTEPASLEMETNQVIIPTERTPLLETSWSQSPGLPEQTEGLILQPSNTAKYGLRTLVGRLMTSTSVQAEGPQVKQTIETAFATATQGMSTEPKVTVNQGEETESKIPVGIEEIEFHGKESMQGAWTGESVKSQMPSYTQAGWAETLQPHTDFSLVTGIIGSQNSDRRARLRRTLSSSQEMAAASSGTKPSNMELKTKGLSFLDRPFRLGSTRQSSPGTEVKEHGSSLEGILLPMHETSTAHTWVSGSRNLTKTTGFGSSVEVRKETTSSTVSKQEHTLPYERKISEITITSEGSPRVSGIGSSRFIATLALGNQTSKYKEEQTNSPPLWNMQSTGNSESFSPQFLSKFSSKPREMSPFIEKEPINLENATKEMLLGVKWATADAEKDLAPKTSVPPLLDMQSTMMSQSTTRGSTLPLTTGLLKSPEFVSYKGEPGAISPLKETLSSTAGITTSSMIYSTSAVPIQTLEIQASIPVETRDLTNRTTKKSGEVGLETYVGTEIYTMPSARASSLGLHEGHSISTVETKVIGIPQPETIWPTYQTVEGKQTKPFQEKGRRRVSILGEKTTAESLGMGSEKTGQNGGGIIAITTTAAKLASQSGYAHSSPSFMEEPTIIHGKKEAMNISVGPTRKLVLEMMGSPIPSDGRTTEMALSVFDSQNNLDSEKTKTTLHLEISPEGMYLTDMESTEGVTATTGVSLVDSQTLSPNEVRIQLKYHKPHVSQGSHSLKGGNGHSGLLPSQRNPSVVGNWELLSPSTEASMPASKTHTAIRQEEMSQMKTVVPENKKYFSVDNPTFEH